VHYTDLRAALRQEPFVPFRLHLTDGRWLDVPNRRWMIVMREESSVGLPNETGEPETGIIIWNDQIKHIEMLSLPAVT